MPTTDGARFDCILRVNFFLSTFTAKAHNISPSIISATNRLEAVDAFAEAFMTYACDGMMGRVLGEGKRRKAYNWKGRNKEGKGSRDEERPSKPTSFAVALEPNRCIRTTIVRVSDSQDGGFDNVTVDPTSPVSPTLWRRRHNRSGSMPDIMSAELPLINRNHPRREPARHLVTSATSFAALLELARVVRR